jgi:dihydrofolate reductase
MRKVILQMQMSLDGFVCGPNDELDWMLPVEDKRILEALDGISRGMDTILMGRKMSAGFFAYWEGVVDEGPENPEYEYAQIFVSTPKVVFSHSVTETSGVNARMENRELRIVLAELKSGEGGYLVAYGGAHFAGSLLSAGLVDELCLVQHPVALGAGKGIFTKRMNLKLVESIKAENGMVLNRYEPRL